MHEPQTWDAFRFTWAVPSAGFEWADDARPVDDRSDAQPPYLVMSRKDEGRLYRPLEEVPHLFSTFASLQQTPADFLDFAREYGWLGIGIDMEKALISDKWGRPEEPGSTDHTEDFGSQPPLGPPMVVGKGGRKYVPFYGEPMGTWQKEVSAFAPLVCVWQQIERRDRAKLEEHIIWTPGRVQFHYMVQDGERIPGPIQPQADMMELLASGTSQMTVENIAADGILHPEVFRSFTHGDVYAPARFLLLKNVNQKLHGSASPHLVIDDEGQLHPYIIPHHLLGALWLQFYRAVTGERKFRPCEICGEWMDVTELNADKRMHDVCSNRERQRRWRERSESRT